jgi:ubiquinol-cytochrome c reductase cytochrome b subunit
MPNWETNLWGHTVSWNVVVPALVPLGLIMTGAAVWPFIEQWATGDRRIHHFADRPRNAPFRTAVGMTVVAFYGLLWLAGGNDVLADRFDISLYATTWFFRIAVFVGPVIAYIVTKRICIGLQRSDAAELDHGVESGIIKMMPSGEFIEVHEPVKEEAEAVLRAKPEPAELEAAPEDENGIPSPGSRGPMGRARKTLNNAFTADDIPVGDGNGHPNGHGDGNGQRPEIEGGDHKELSRG